MSKKKKVYEPRLRTRGGPGVRDRWTRIVSRMKRDHKCPRCSCPSVKRDSVGIWSCEKCGYTFAGGAYTPKTKQGRAPIRVREYSQNQFLFILHRRSSTFWFDKDYVP